MKPDRFQVLSSLLIVGVLAFTGCGRKKIDTSTDERMKKSIETVRASLPEQDRDKFDESLVAITTSKLDISDIIGGRTGNMEAKIKESLNGKTAAEVIAAGQVIVAQRGDKVREFNDRVQEFNNRGQKEALAEIAELRKSKESAERAKTELAKFKVTRSRFYKNTIKNPYIGDLIRPVVELSLVNQTSVSVSRVYFTGTLSSPGRAVAWLKDDFDYDIPGGMEPAETKEVKLNPFPPGRWERVELPADAVLTVEVRRLDGPDKKAAFNADAFSERDAERLKALEATIAK